MVQRFYCCSTCYRHGRVFSIKHNSFCIMSEERILAINSGVFFTSVRKRYNVYITRDAHETFYCKSFPWLCFHSNENNCLAHSYYLLQFISNIMSFSSTENKLLPYLCANFRSVSMETVDTLNKMNFKD